MSAERYDEGEPDDAMLPALPPIDLGRVAASLPGLARITARGWLNVAEWGFSSTFRLSRRLVAAGRDPEVAQELAAELGLAVGTVGELARQVAAGVPLPTALREASAALGPAAAMDQDDDSAPERLRAQGERLLQRSRDVWGNDDEHPAYARILSELAPDEARVLVLLYRDGPQPSVDVRTGGPVGLVSSRLLAPGLNMIAGRAGVRHLDSVPSYLNNLHRLGLLWFSREQLSEAAPYQVLEAQPDVLAALKSVSFPKVIRRSIHLTPFGRDFVRATLVDEEGPEHGVPPDDDVQP